MPRDVDLIYCKRVLGNVFHGKKRHIDMITRWEKWYTGDNLRQDERILAAPHSQSAENAATAFLAKGKRRVLDLACGIGRDTLYLASRGLAVTGADAALNGLQVAQRRKWARGIQCTFTAVDARHLAFGTGSFDAVYCFGLLHEFVGENRTLDVTQIMAEIKRVLCEQGLLALTVLAGDPEAGLPQVQFFTRQMFEQATDDLQTIEIEVYNDVGCTNRTDYHIWYGLFES